MLSADQLRYQHPDDLAVARGNVRISRDGNVYSGPELQLHVQRFEGFFLQPSYHFGRTGAGGTARRIDFIDEQRAAGHRRHLHQLPERRQRRAGLAAVHRRVKMDFEANEGIAENAVLRFYGVPIRRAGAQLPAHRRAQVRLAAALDQHRQQERPAVSIPWYWNIAPNRDATLTPLLSAKRGAGAEAEFRYLEPSFQGRGAGA